MSSHGGEPDSPLEKHLDELVAGLSGLPPRQLRALLAEAEAHLRDETEAGVSRGLPRRQAEDEAVARFGPARGVVAAERDCARASVGSLARQAIVSAISLGTVGAIAVGLSGVVAAIIALAGGARALVSVNPGQVLSASDCARWLAADPRAGSCRAAALSDWTFETIAYRIVVGILGVAVFVLLRAARRRRPPARRRSGLDPVVVNTVAVLSFGAVGVWTVGMGIDQIVLVAGQGSGQWFSATLVALAVAAAFGVRLTRDLRGPHLHLQPRP